MFIVLQDSRTILICDNRLTEAPAWLHCDGLAVLPSSWVLDSLSQCLWVSNRLWYHDYCALYFLCISLSFAVCYQPRSINTDQWI